MGGGWSCSDELALDEDPLSSALRVYLVSGRAPGTPGDFVRHVDVTSVTDEEDRGCFEALHRSHTAQCAAAALQRYRVDHRLCTTVAEEDDGRPATVRATLHVVHDRLANQARVVLVAQAGGGASDSPYALLLRVVEALARDARLVTHAEGDGAPSPHGLYVLEPVAGSFARPLVGVRTVPAVVLPPSGGDAEGRPPLRGPYRRGLPDPGKAGGWAVRRDFHLTRREATTLALMQTQPPVPWGITLLPWSPLSVVAVLRVPVRGDFATLCLLHDGASSCTLPVFAAPRFLDPVALLAPLLMTSSPARLTSRAATAIRVGDVRDLIGDNLQDLVRAELAATCGLLHLPDPPPEFRWEFGEGPPALPEAPPLPGDIRRMEVSVFADRRIARRNPAWLVGWLQPDVFRGLREFRVVVRPSTRTPAHKMSADERRSDTEERLRGAPLPPALLDPIAWPAVERVSLGGAPLDDVMRVLERDGHGELVPHRAPRDAWWQLIADALQRRHAPLPFLAIEDLLGMDEDLYRLPEWMHFVRGICRDLQLGDRERCGGCFVDTLCLPAAPLLRVVYRIMAAMSDNIWAYSTDGGIERPGRPDEFREPDVLVDVWEVVPRPNDALVLTGGAWVAFDDVNEGFALWYWSGIMLVLANSEPRGPRYRTLVVDWSTQPCGAPRRDDGAPCENPTCPLPGGEKKEQFFCTPPSLRMELVVRGGPRPAMRMGALLRYAVHTLAMHRDGGTVLRLWSHDGQTPGLVEAMIRSIAAHRAATGDHQPLCVHLRVDAGLVAAEPALATNPRSWLATLLLRSGLVLAGRATFRPAPWCLVLDGSGLANPIAWGAGLGGLGPRAGDDSEAWLLGLARDLAQRDPESDLAVAAGLAPDGDGTLSSLRRMAADLHAGFHGRPRPLAHWYLDAVRGHVFVLPDCTSDAGAAHALVNGAMRRIHMQPSTHNWLPPDP